MLGVPCQSSLREGGGGSARWWLTPPALHPPPGQEGTRDTVTPGRPGPASGVGSRVHTAHSAAGLDARLVLSRAPSGTLASQAHGSAQPAPACEVWVNTRKQHGTFTRFILAPKSPIFSRHFCSSREVWAPGGAFQHHLTPPSQPRCELRLLGDTHRGPPA